MRHGIAAIMIMGALFAMSTQAETTGLDFHALMTERQSVGELPALKTFAARDGTGLGYRHYPSESDLALILVHGSAADSRYLSTLAQALATSGAAEVYTPDLRGHGPSPVRRGDIDYISQLEDDLAGLILHVKANNPNLAGVVVGGHSSGGGLAVRFAGGQHGNLASAFLMLAPYLGHDAPTVRSNSGGWAAPSLARIIPIAMLNALGVTRFNDTQVLRFNLPAEYQDGAQTLSYSYRLMAGFGPADREADLARLKVPFLLVVGSDDESFFASEFEPVVRPHVPHARIEIIEGVSHLGLVTDEQTIALVLTWLRQEAMGE